MSATKPDSSAEAKIQALSTNYQAIQTTLQDIITARQKLESQQTENTSVKHELSLLSSDSGIYKLVGPVLMKQDRTEADMAVDGRLEFIKGEIKRVDGRIGELEGEAEGIKMEVMKLQGAMSTPAAGNAQAVEPAQG